MTIIRRDLLRLLLASAVSEAVDVERLFWTPKAIVTVPKTFIGYADVKDFSMSGDAYMLGVLRSGLIAFNINYEPMGQIAWVR